MSGRNLRMLTAFAAAAAAVFLGGCSRSQMNYQIAECIGTLGEYENNEPVETPKMQAEREQKESEEALEKERVEVLSQAEALAEGYWYEEAINLLSLTDSLQDDSRAEEAIASYQEELDSMYTYDGSIGHLCFPSLVVDTELAFDGDDYAQTYRQNLITLDEFQGILEQLYANGYVLIDIHSLAEETEDDSGNVTMTAASVSLPKGKKPLVLSVDNLNYASVRSSDGIAVKLALDTDGEVGAVYQDGDGHEYTGAYDVVPVVEQFIEEHPDFSFRGARGIISVSGSDGVFGYQVEEGTDEDYESNQQTVKAIAEKLRSDGWTFASCGYSYQYMNDLSYDSLKSDITKWKAAAGSLLNGCDTILYPYGSEVDYTSEKAVYLTDEGFRYLVGLWADNDYLEVSGTYLRQTRRAVTGYILENYPGNFADWFTVSDILDSSRSGS